MCLSYILTHPTAVLARNIENLMLNKEKQSNPLVRAGFDLTSRVVSMTVFPVFLTLECLLKRVPKVLMAVGTDKFQEKTDKLVKYSLSIVPSAMLGFAFPEGMPGFFLKRCETDREVYPFGVEKVFGKKLQRPIDFPTTAEDVQKVVKRAKERGQQVSVMGAGMSQGTQAVPEAARHRVINTKYLNHIQVNATENTVTVGSGATWEQIQLELDKVNKSVIVKQASDIFSVGGSIGINCHGWAHEYGAISSTVRSLKVVDAEGNLRTLTRPRPGVPVEELTEDELLFKCQFGTLGYFGVVVEATLDIVDNEKVLEDTVEVDRDHFVETYLNQVKGQDVPLFGGRLILDTLDGDPMRDICMVSYRRVEGPDPLAMRNLTAEPKWGTRVERIALKLISHLPQFCVSRMISAFWGKEKSAMMEGRVMTRNEALHPPINSFKFLHHSGLHAQWLQEYFVDQERLPNFLRFLGAELKANEVRLINATIRPTPKDDISILPYADKDRFAVVICFAQKKTEEDMARTRKWIENVNAYLAHEGGVFYQAYMPYATVKQFETCYGKERVDAMRALKQRFDPGHVFGSAHTTKYYDQGVVA